MTQQAINSMNLYRGGNPATIEQLLRMQRSSVVDELKQHFGASDLHELAIKLSLNWSGMKKYVVYFTTKSGDYDKEWCSANSPEEAAQIIESEHWNIASIDHVCEM